MITEFHLDQPLDGKQNMWLDESFFHKLNQSFSRSEGNSNETTIIRIYEWLNPTLSLGIAQNNDIFNSNVKKDDIKVVSRITGGRVVLHYQEITYAVIGCTGGFWGNTLHETYIKISEILKQFLINLGISVDVTSTPKSFATTTASHANYKHSLSCYDTLGFKEISVNGKKLIGSAQKRGENAFLQHGSIPFYRHDFRVEDYLKPTYQPSKPMDDAYIFINDFIDTPISTAKEVLANTFTNALNSKTVTSNQDNYNTLNQVLSEHLYE